MGLHVLYVLRLQAFYVLNTYFKFCINQILFIFNPLTPLLYIILKFKKLEIYTFYR